MWRCDRNQAIESECIDSLQEEEESDEDDDGDEEDEDDDVEVRETEPDSADEGEIISGQGQLPHGPVEPSFLSTTRFKSFTNVVTGYD